MIEQENQTPIPQSIIKKIFQNESISFVINKAQQTSVSIYKKDYQSLLPQRWLRTQAIDLILKLMHQKYIQKLQTANSYAQSQSKVQIKSYLKIIDLFVTTMIMMNDEDFILQSLKPLQLFSEFTKYILIPINSESINGSHWFLIFLINGRYKQKNNPMKLVIFDSTKSHLNIAHKMAQKIVLMCKLFYEEVVQIQLIEAENILYQSNSYDCGIYTIGYCEYILEEIVREIQDINLKLQDKRFDQMKQQFKYILANSDKAREKYRRYIENYLWQMFKQQK